MGTQGTLLHTTSIISCWAAPLGFAFLPPVHVQYSGVCCQLWLMQGCEAPFKVPAKHEACKC